MTFLQKKNLYIIKKTIDMNKTCNKCYLDKDISEFYKSPTCKLGVRSNCKKCTNYKYVKKGRKCNPDFDMKEYQKEYHSKNQETIKESKRKHYIKNKEHYNNYAKEYNSRRRKEDSIFKITGNIRNLIKNSFLRKFTKKSKKTIEILGCEFDFFNKYITDLFDEFMTMENYGTYWEIDHIEPISSALTIEDLIRLNHYSNLRPFKKEDNRTKGNKYQSDSI